MVGIAVVGMLGGAGCTVFAVQAAMSVGADVRDALFEKIQSFSFGNLDQLGTGELITRVTNDVTQIQDVVLILLRIMVRSPLLVVGSLIMAILTSPQLSWLLFVLVPVIVAILAWGISRSVAAVYHRAAKAGPLEHGDAGKPGGGAGGQGLRARAL